jgi:hypothetical protein
MNTNDWQQSNMQHFWGDIASTDHLVQFYEDDQSFINTLEGFAGSGFIAKESVIVIASDQHLKLLNARLTSNNFDLPKLITQDLYIPIDAEEALENFMIKGMPDETRFLKLVGGLIKRAKKNGDKFRGFGEMVAILLDKGQTEAMIRLEQLWNQFCEKEPFCLYCAYPKKAKTLVHSMDICSEHSKVISGVAGPSTQIRFKNIGTPLVRNVQ